MSLEQLNSLSKDKLIDLVIKQADAVSRICGHCVESYDIYRLYDRKKLIEIYLKNEMSYKLNII